ncbi:MAG TPA: endoribonuclease MazF [Actinomycetota bacterium]
MAAYAPERGDLVWLTFDARGHEQAGRRPALVISPRAYNRKVGLALCCPVTSKAKGYPFEVELRSAGAIAGVVLSDQVRSLDWRARRAKRAGAVRDAVLAEVTAKLLTLVAPR